MVQFLPLPAIAYPQNAMINFQPMNQALQFYANNQLERGRFGLQQNADQRAQEMHPLQMDQTRAQTGLANAHGAFYEGQNRRADVMQPLEMAHRRAQTGLLGAQAGMTNAHAGLYRAQTDNVAEVQALRRRQTDALELQRDRGFALRMLQELNAADTPEAFNNVARILAPRLRRMPTFNERGALLASLGEALDEYDLVQGPDGQMQRVSRGLAPDAAAVMRGHDPQVQSVQAAGSGVGGLGGLRTMLPPQSTPPPTAVGQMSTEDILRRFPVLGPVGTGAAPAPGPQAPPTQQPMRPAPVVGPAVQPQPINPMAVTPRGNGMIQPISAPGMVLPAPSSGNAMIQPTQGATPASPGAPVPRGAMGARQAQISEIETQYGNPSTWTGNNVPPMSVVQRYWQSVHGGRPQAGMQFQANGTLQPMPGASPRGGNGGRGGGSNAAANATQVLAETVPQMENAVEYMLNSNVLTNMAGQIPGASAIGVTGFNNARSSLQFGTSAIMHSLSGATTTEREFQRYVDAFLPSAGDLDNVRRYKLNSLMMIVRGIQARIQGGTVNDDVMAPIRRQMLEEQRKLLGLAAGGGASPAGGAATPGGWGGAGGMSTQDIINNLGRR